MIEVRPATPADEDAWRALWDSYCDFYAVEVSEPVTRATWERLLAPDSPMHGLVASEGLDVVGFANYVLHPYTWSEQNACYLEDLFVDPRARGRGTGRALVEAVIDRARDSGCSRVYWHTRSDNAGARALYDSFARADDFVRYVVDLARPGL